MADNFKDVGKGDEDRAKEIVIASIQRFEDMVVERQPLNGQCEEIAALIQPSHVGSFNAHGMTTPYTKKTEQQIDASGMLAADRFMAICDSMLTPKNHLWHGLTAGGRHADQLMKDRATRMWFYNTTRTLFRYRYSPVSNFVSQNQGVWHSLGSYGNGTLFIDKFYDLNKKIDAFRYINIPFGEIYHEFNHQGVVDGFIRVMKYKARQAAKVPEFQGNLPAEVLEAAGDPKRANREFTFLHRVCPRDEYKPWMLDNRNMPYASYYICVETKTLMREGGYQSLPISATQYITAPGEQYGRSIAMSVLPSLKTLNAEKRVFLKQGHRAADPVLLLADDGVMNMNLKPGAQNRGGWSSDGKPLVGVLPSGEIQISEEMMALEKGLIDDAFLVALFAIAAEPKSGTTATEVIERIQEKGILIAPTLGRQENYLARNIDRELDLLSQMRVLEPMPPLLREAQGDYTVAWSSPLARAQRAQEAAGFMRTVETASGVANITGDPSYLDRLDFDVAIPEIAEINGVPEPWLASDDVVAAKREARRKAAEMQQQIQAAPGAAALMGAQAKQAAAGVQPGAPA
ncbi:MAG: portal protein [Reyranella sp.]|uniref:portal protein n=1 Tax=Reyranella sp. TaxID=1929291 RepID=UPI003D135D9D